MRGAYDQTSENKSLWSIKKETCRAKDLNQGIRQVCEGIYTTLKLQINKIYPLWPIGYFTYHHG
jgi:hypothetical protein